MASVKSSRRFECNDPARLVPPLVVVCPCPARVSIECHGSRCCKGECELTFSDVLIVGRAAEKCLKQRKQNRRRSNATSPVTERKARTQRSVLALGPDSFRRPKSAAVSPLYLLHFTDTNNPDNIRKTAI
ncbi:unnamed protein product [Toxocara canis]|uniref:WAP domain-containing protein n=1 Tax=Toxocara canis TaxID=6265 RepID=A0A183V0J8_TOXCA|nr:unnamed protein product [Toxocara canis]